MIRINLIPHRIAFRQKQIIEYITVFVAAVLIIIALIITVDVWATQGLTELQEEQAALRIKNTALSKKIGELRNLDTLRKDVEGKLQIVDELQAGRFRSLNTLDAIANSIPQNVWIKQLQDKSGALSLTGLGESSKAVANFMRALEVSPVFDNVTLQVDREFKLDGINVRKFKLTFRRLTLAEQEERKVKGDQK